LNRREKEYMKRNCSGVKVRFVVLILTETHVILSYIKIGKH
jgi:hypothetical protein